MSDVVHLRRKPRPLQRRYHPDAPYAVVRNDNDNGSISYEIFDERPGSYRFVCGISDYDGNPYAKHDAEQIARALNLMVQYGKETLPTVRDLD